MTKHDTWVKLKPGNPYEPILDMFPDGMIPMRDPFPLERVTTADGEQVTLWIVDLERLSSIQTIALAQTIAHHCGTDPSEVAQEATAAGGFSMKHEWIDSMLCGPEGFQRQKELADFLETAPQPPSAKAYREFYNSQYTRWIEGDEVPPPINSIEDVDPRLRTPALKQALKMHQIQTAIAQGGYSVLDVLTGRAFVDALNQIDPQTQYFLVGEPDDFDEDEIYEY
ncbi:hypothetical protein [Nostoc sp. 2RC]|uniref:hypothetical protein n=1 Tax=Nostoc sp. 2RC TaxID=2485484 RepID=UPI001626E0F8|nr:hypothetical protein [Nostoc sp. 2RC]MBC1242200.1 hypothetical protein [Nostoc sp. 2RC]